MKHLSLFVHMLVCIAGLGLSACGAGVPLELHIDEFKMTLDMDDAVSNLHKELVSSGVFPTGSVGLPEIWPATLPPLQYAMSTVTAPVPIDLTPEKGSDNEDKYKKINQAGNIIQRIEINRLILRIEQGNMSINMPELKLQAADTVDANPNDRRAWYTLGQIPNAEPTVEQDGTITWTPEDLEFEWLPGGESFLNGQMADDLKEFAIRAVGKTQLDTTINPVLPRGKISLRLIVVATFYVKPEGIFAILKKK